MSILAGFSTPSAESARGLLGGVSLYQPHLRAFKWKMDICYLAQLAQLRRLGAQVAQVPRSERLERGQDIRCLRKLGDPGHCARYGVWGFLKTPTNTPLFDQSLILNPTTYWPGIKRRRNW